MKNVTAVSKTGKYIGHILENGVIEYLGIPYACPPKRWKKAEPLPAGSQEFIADKCGPACWQPLLPEEWADTPPMSEDCLTLNIWTADIEKKDKPVLVWIHGGCYETGSNRTDCFNGIYCGDRFVEASPDIVYVNINYRLNIFGCCDLSKFDTTGEYTDSNNLQTYDQMEALRWIHENISAFGGDPNRVTISGQSAGGFSVTALMALPEANRYFQQVISQSTAVSDVLLKRRSDAQEIADIFYEIAGVDSLQDLLDMPAEKLCEYAHELFLSGGPSAPPFELIWGEGIFPYNPCESIRNGAAKHIRLMIGTVSGEFDAASHEMSIEDLTEIVEGLIPGKLTPDIIDAYLKNDPARGLKTSYQDLWNDALLRIGSINFAEAQAFAGGDVYLYYAPYVSEGAQMRPQHCFEIPYVNMKKDNLAYMDFSCEPVQGVHPSDTLEKELHECWAGFIRSGDPNGPHISIHWPAYTCEGRETAVIDRTWSVANGIRNKDIDLLLPIHQMG